MAQTNTTRATRSEDTSGTLLEVACLSAIEGAETRLWQRVHIADPVTPTQHLLIDASGNIGVSALFTAIHQVSAQVSGALSAFVFAGGQLAVSAQVSAGSQISAQLSAGGLLSAWAIPASQLIVSAQLSGGGAVSAFTAGQAISAFTAGQAISAFTAGQAISAWPAGTYYVSATQALTLSAAAFNISATGTIVAATAASSVFVYAGLLVSEASGGWHKFQSSGTATTDLMGFTRADAFGGYILPAVNPPAYLFKTAAGSALALNQSATVSALAGFISYWIT